MTPENRFTIPHDHLDEVVVIPLGFQPLGITSRARENGSHELLIACYFEPAVCHMLVTRDDTGMHFETSFVRGVENGVDSVRIFTGTPLHSDVNRCQTANFGPNGTWWITRNGGNDIFVIEPPTETNGCGRLVQKIMLPTDRMLHSVHVGAEQDGIVIVHTTESYLAFDQWWEGLYEVDGDEVRQTRGFTLTKTWIYGFGKHPGYSNPFMICDPRSNADQGIYYMEMRRISEIGGSGICFLSDGTGIVARYGQTYPGPFSGRPGSLIIIPPDRFYLFVS